ncbi:MAG: twin-arginine translocase TatA/TatE family subunit [Pseudomonadota bacterium]
MGIGSMGIGGILIIAVVVLVLFGRGKIANLMGEIGKGITAFKRGVNDSKDEIEDASDGSAARDITPESDRDKA